MNPEDGTLEINSDTYGKGMLVMMAASDSITLDELVDLLAEQK